MHTFQLKTITLAVFGALILAGCGADSTGKDASGKNAATRLQHAGVITGFGSVFVNGVKYETGRSSVTLDGVASSESHLEVGMVVTLEGDVNDDGVTGTATSIQYADELEGTVSAMNIALDGTGTLTVMGQTVTIDSATVFESDIVSVTAIGNIAVGNIVEVSGYSAGSGSILATRVEVKKAIKEPGDEIELKGVIAGLDTTAKTFMLGALMVHYGDAKVEHTPANGLYVQVKSTTTPSADNMLTASKVEVEGDGDTSMDGETGDEFELEGIVTSIVSSTEFVLNGQHVLVDPGKTEFEHGSATDIILNAKLEVEGTLNADGKLVADEIEFRVAGKVGFEGFLESVDVTAGTVTLRGKTIKVNNLTVMIDKRDENGVIPEHFFDLTDLIAGQRIQVKAYADAGGALIATLLKRENGTVPR